MNLAADMGRHSGRATPSLHDAPYRQCEQRTGRRSTYQVPIPVQTNPATSLRPGIVLTYIPLMIECEVRGHTIPWAASHRMV